MMTEGRVLVIGSPGSGKSTLAEMLAAALALPLIHLDQLNWQPDQTTLSKAEFRQKLAAVIQQDRWLIDGNYASTLEMRIKAADTVIWLKIPRLICLYRVLKRNLTAEQQKNSHGNPRLLEKTFLKFIWDFPQKNEPQMTALQEKYQDHCRFIILKKADLKTCLAALQDNSK